MFIKPSTLSREQQKSLSEALQKDLREDGVDVATAKRIGDLVSRSNDVLRITSDNGKRPRVNPGSLKNQKP
jgi:hypothetical protein